MESADTTKFVKSVFLDIVDYSKRNIESQKLVVSERDKIIVAALETLTIREEERILLPIGDGLYIALLTPPEKYDLHLKLVLEILRRLSDYNSNALESQRFELRFGIDECVDEIVTDINNRPNVAGEGANMASRIMGLADGGQVLVSQFAHRQLFKRAHYQGRFRDLPSKEVKHGVLVHPFQYIDGSETGLNCELPSKWREDGSNKEEIMSRPPLASEAPVAVEGEHGQDEVMTESDAELTKGERQVAETVTALTQAISNRAYAAGIRLSGEIDDFQLLRIQLLATSWLESQIPNSMLGTHEANRLYLHRDKLLPTRPELFSILRMVVYDSSGYIPGWYWHKTIDSQTIERVIIHFALSDSLSILRQQAFELLYSGGVPIPEEVRERLALTITSDSAPEVRRAATRYLGRIGDASYLPIVGSASVDSESSVVYQAKESKYLILARTDPNRTFKELLSDSRSDVDQILLELAPKTNEIVTSALTDALGNSNDDIRLFALKELVRRGEMTIELTQPLKDDKSEGIKLEAYRFLILKGVPFEAQEIASDIPDNRLGRWLSRKLISKRFLKRPQSIGREEVILEFYRRFDLDELIQMTDWSEWSGHDAYRALACEHFNDFGESLQEDLRTDFAVRSKVHYERELVFWKDLETRHPTTSAEATSFPSLFGSLFGPTAPTNKAESTPESSAQNSVETTKGYYIAAALAGLARNGSPSDVNFGRQFLFHGDEDTRIEAVKVVKKCGNSEDVSDLSKIAKSEDGLLQELAAKAALDLSDNVVEAAADFLTAGDEVLVSLTIAELMRQADEGTIGEFLKPYLYNENSEVRTRVMTFFAMRYETNQLEKLLIEYTREQIYYYDVVSCFDKILYSPTRLATAHLESLKDTFFGLLEESTMTSTPAND